MSTVLVTGATGFVGRHLCMTLFKSGFRVIGTTRLEVRNSTSLDHELRTVADLGGEIDWGPFLNGVDYVVHLAARVHIMQDIEKDPLAAFRRVNVHGTEQLLRHDGMKGVKRFVYLSTVKVHGDETHDSPFFATDLPTPPDPYSQSKFEAERLVTEIGTEIGLETVIVRPPLVYGPGVGGNFLRLLRMIDRGYPLPLASVENRRSIVGIQNLCSLIAECLINPAAAGKQFLVSDGEDVATPKLLRLIAASMSRPSRLVPVPVAILQLVAKLLGRGAEASRLTGSLQVDIDETQKTLEWKPPVSMADEIKSTVDWFQEQKVG